MRHVSNRGGGGWLEMAASYGHEPIRRSLIFEVAREISQISCGVEW